MSPDLSSDLNRLRVELQALGGVLDALLGALGPAQRAAWKLEVQETARAKTVPDEHLVSYA